MRLAPAFAAFAELAGPPPRRQAGRDAAAAAPLGLDAEAFEPFYAATAPRLRGYLRRITGSPAVADDLMQESYVRFLTHPPAPGRELQGSAYLFRIATNLARDRWRWERRQASLLERLFQPAGTASTPERSLAAKLDFAAAFARLSSRDRALLWLAYVEGYEHAEIAAILTLRPASVRVLLFRLRRRVAALLPDLQSATGDEP